MTGDTTAQVRLPVAPRASFDALRERGTCGWDETSGTFTVCPSTGEPHKRTMLHPADVPDAGPLSGSETITILQGDMLVKIPLSALAALLSP